jgi:hypothetical protein
MDLPTMKNYIQQKQQKLNKSQNNFYTSSGIHVFVKEPVDGIDIGNVILKMEELLPVHFLHEIEMIIFGWFDEFDERSVKAFYDSGTLYISNIQYDEDEVLEHIIHEIAHSLESTYGYEIYGDQKIQSEFIRKRRQLHDILFEAGYKLPMSFFMNTEFDQEFDDLLYKKIGYDKIDQFASGMFINSYAATSLREYFATAVADFYINTNHNFLKKISPAVYNKIMMLQDPEALDKT